MGTRRIQAFRDLSPAREEVAPFGGLGGSPAGVQGGGRAPYHDPTRDWSPGTPQSAHFSPDRSAALLLRPTEPQVSRLLPQYHRGALSEGSWIQTS